MLSKSAHNPFPPYDNFRSVWSASKQASKQAGRQEKLCFPTEEKEFGPISIERLSTPLKPKVCDIGERERERGGDNGEGGGGGEGGELLGKE